MDRSETATSCQIAAINMSLPTQASGQAVTEMQYRHGAYSSSAEIHRSMRLC
jgi:hypothetical protein